MEQTSNPPHPRLGREPRAIASVRVLAVIFGIFLLALAAAAGIEAWIAWSDSPWASWFKPFFSAFSREELPRWLLILAVLSVLCGVFFLIAAFKPRRRTHWALRSSTISIWIRPVDVARACSAAAGRTPGVAAARSLVSKKKADVVAHGDLEDVGLQERVAESVRSVLTPLPDPPRVSVVVERVADDMGDTYQGKQV